MRDNQLVFIDTNILIYRIYGTAEQKESVLGILGNQVRRPVISTQVLNELANASFKKKLNRSGDELKQHLLKTVESFTVAEISPKTVITAVDIKEKYHYSFYDSLIIATALENNCNILFSEDLQHQQIIRGKLKIINPFK